MTPVLICAVLALAVAGWTVVEAKPWETAPLTPWVYREQTWRISTPITSTSIVTAVITTHRVASGAIHWGPSTVVPVDPSLPSGATARRVARDHQCLAVACLVLLVIHVTAAVVTADPDIGITTGLTAMLAWSHRERALLYRDRIGATR